ncbi:MAG: hypothetical protein LBF71_05190 [Campylobacteraceae bacterium]|jgi:hypothetical protein|nr:hypothetical protein [Campylobacteraceae bacterium]
MKALLLCIFVAAFAADNDSNSLANALYSDNLSLGVIDQQGVFFVNYPTIKQENDNFMSFKSGTSTFRFTGIGLLESNYNPMHMDVKDPAFMFNIKLNGDNSVEIGGGVRNLNLGDWTDLVNEIIDKKEESR